MKVGVSLFMQNAGDWDRFESAERGAPTGPAAVPDWKIWEEDLRLGRLVEPLGFDSLWSVEHHFTPYTMVPDVLQLLAYFAGCTERISLGTMVVVLPWHDPIRVAEGIAALDGMLGGRRLDVGFGRGLGRREFGALRVPMEESRERFLEALEIVRRALTHEWFSYEGRCYQIPRTTLRPQPRSSDLLAHMYCAWGSPQTIPVAAQTGLKALFIPQTSWVDYAKQMERFATLRAEAGFAPAHPTVVCWVYCAPSEAEAWEGARRWIPGYANTAARHYELASDHFARTKGYEHYASLSSLMNDTGSGYDMGAMYLGNQVWGTPAQCVAKIAEIERLMHPDHFVAVMKYGGMPLADAEASMRLFAAEALPLVKQIPVARL